MEIIVENQFPSRFDRQLVIKKDGVEIKFDVMDARSPEAHTLALDLMFAAGVILHHHELKNENK